MTGYEIIKKNMKTKESMIKNFIDEGMCPSTLSFQEDSSYCFTGVTSDCNLCWNEALEKEYDEQQ